MDYLAEVTMSILQKQKLKDPNLGYARDIPPLMERLLPVIKEKNIKVITTAVDLWVMEWGQSRLSATMAKKL